MNIHSFKIAKKYSLENRSLNESSSVDLFVDKQHENAINEGIISSIVRWYKQNFSPRASKMKKMGKEYYEWLSKEYRSLYKEDRWNDTPVESFLKKETPSSDIETQLKALAKTDVDYTELASKIVLENKIKAKKDFCEEHLGPEDKLTRKYAEEEAEVAKDVQRTMKNMSRRDASKFEFDIKTLRDRIQTGLQPVIAAKIAAGISIFCQIRKLRSGVDFSSEDLWEEFTHGERDFMKMHPKFNSLKGVEFMYSIRCLKTPDLLKIEHLIADDIQNQVDKTIDTLKSIGVEWENEAHWGLVQLYLMQRDAKSQQETLATIKKKISSMTEDQVNDFSNDVQSDLDDIKSRNLEPEEEQAAVDKLETKLGTDSGGATSANSVDLDTDKEQKSDKSETEDELKSQDEPKHQDEPLSNEVASKMLAEVKARPVHLLEGIKDYLFALASAIEKNDRYVWNPAAKRTNTAIKSGLSKSNTGIPVELIDNALSYVIQDLPMEDGKLTQKSFNDCLDSNKVKQAAEALYEDYKTCLGIWNEQIEKSDNDTQKELVSKDFFASLFKAKDGSLHALSIPEAKEKMKDTFTYYL